MFDLEVTLIVGEPHSFDVYVNGELVFSRVEEGRFPETAEIAAAISALAAAPPAQQAQQAQQAPSP